VPADKGRSERAALPAPRVHAVIPAYNAAATIARALSSVLAQDSQREVEVIVVDDGSTDDTAEAVREQYPDVTLIQQENRGVGAARNRGLRVAHGDYIAFLDADDEWSPTHLSDIAHLARLFPDAGLLSTGYAFVPDERIRTVVTHGSGAPVEADFLRASRSIWVAHTSATAVRRDTALALGGFREDMPLSEDTEFFARMYLASGFAFHPRVSSTYYGGSSTSAVARHRETPSSMMMFEALLPWLQKGNLPPDKLLSLRRFLTELLFSHCRWCLTRSRRREALETLQHPLLAQHRPMRRRMRVLSLAPGRLLSVWERFRQSRWGAPARTEADGFVRTTKTFRRAVT